MMEVIEIMVFRSLTEKWTDVWIFNEGPVTCGEVDRRIGI